MSDVLNPEYVKMMRNGPCSPCIHTFVYTISLNELRRAMREWERTSSNKSRGKQKGKKHMNLAFFFKTKFHVSFSDAKRLVRVAKGRGKMNQ